LLENIHPNILALMAATFIAVARMFYQSALTRLHPTIITFLVNSISIPFAALFYWMGGGVERWPVQGLVWFVLVGLIGSLFGRYLSFVAQRIVGVARTAIVMQSVLIWSMGLAVIFLGEHLSRWIAAGSFLILVGGILLVSEKGEDRKKIPLVYYLIPLFTALCFALTFLIRRYGLVWIPSSSLGMSVSNVTGSIVMAGGLWLRSGKGTRFQNWGSVPIVLLGGILNSAAALCFWTAIQTGKIVQVVPINRLSVLFVILLSWLFMQAEEVITWRVVLGGVLSVAGVFVIVL
jgi:transporter family protein